MSDEFISVATFSNPKEAELARRRLEAGGVRSLLMDCETSAKSWHLNPLNGAVKLMVSVADEEGAIEILERRISKGDKADDDDSNEDLQSPDAAETDPDAPTAKELDAERAFKSQIFAFVFFPLQLVALAFIVKVSMSRERLAEGPARKFKYALVLHPIGWLFFALMAGVFALRR